MPLVLPLFNWCLEQIRLPSTTSDNLPALTMKPYSKIIQDNLNSLHSARKAFISSENDERIRRALSHNVRSSSEIKYISGDSVLYKRSESNEWRGPATVIGHINQQVFVKHGSFYIRVHPCRLQLVKQASRSTDPVIPTATTEEETIKTNHNNKDSSSTNPHNISDSDS